MVMIVIFPLIAGFCMMLRLPHEIYTVLLFAGYAVSIGTVARYSWVAAASEAALHDWQEAVRRACPAHQAAIIKHIAEEEESE